MALAGLPKLLSELIQLALVRCHVGHRGDLGGEFFVLGKRFSVGGDICTPQLVVLRRVFENGHIIQDVAVLWQLRESMLINGKIGIGRVNFRVRIRAIS